MSQSQHAFYDLTLSGDAPFWEGTEVSARRVYLMPSPHNPAEFLAFGTVGSPDNVHFVARGPVATRLASLIDRMLQEEASVELHARAPVPGKVIQQYAGGGGPWEGKIPEEPPEPPSDGRVALSTSPDMDSTNPALTNTTVTLWPQRGNQADAALRRVYILERPAADRFVAFGAILTPDQGSISTLTGMDGFRAPFVARGVMSRDLAGFLARVQGEGIPVARYTDASQLPHELLRKYVTDNATKLW
jgi:hypothetical protein